MKNEHCYTINIQLKFSIGFNLFKLNILDTPLLLDAVLKIIFHIFNLK